MEDEQTQNNQGVIGAQGAGKTQLQIGKPNIFKLAVVGVLTLVFLLEGYIQATTPTLLATPSIDPATGNATGNYLPYTIIPANPLNLGVILCIGMVILSGIYLAFMLKKMLS